MSEENGRDATEENDERISNVMEVLYMALATTERDLRLEKAAVDMHKMLDDLASLPPEIIEKWTREDKNIIRASNREVVQRLHDAACDWLQGHDKDSDWLEQRRVKGDKTDTKPFDFKNVFGEGF